MQEVDAHLVVVEEQPPHVFQHQISAAGHLGRMSGLGEDDVTLAVGLGLSDLT